MKEKIKIGSILLLVFLLTITLVLSVSLNEKSEEIINRVTVTGNYHLSADSYLKFARIENNSDLENLSSIMIRDRIEKHPYLSKVDLLFDNGTLNIRVFEKKFIALLLDENKEYLIDESGLLIPKMADSQNIDYPILSNPHNGDKCREFQKASGNDDLRIGLEIIDALKIIDEELSENISEIDLRDGKDIIMQFAQLDYPIILGRKDEITKLYSLSEVVNKQINNKIKLEYIDLRYPKFVYLGIEEAIENHNI